MKQAWIPAWCVLVLLLAVSPVMAGPSHEKGNQGSPEHSPGLEELMLKTRGQFAAMVEKAYGTGVLRQLKQEDFTALRADAEGIAAAAAKLRGEFSKGKKFDHLAEELAEHAGKTAKAAAAANHPDLNKEIGEMAEYCAACHDAFRW